MSEADVKDVADVGIVGYGYVGRAMYRYFSRAYRVIYYDPDVDGSATEEQINGCKLAVVCVPTPSKEDGSCDTSTVCSSVEWLRTQLILIKSTVSPGTTDRLKSLWPWKRIVYSPEYIGESRYDTGPEGFHQEVDMRGFFIFGGSPQDTGEMVNI